MLHRSASLTLHVRLFLATVACAAVLSLLKCDLLQWSSSSIITYAFTVDVFHPRFTPRHRYDCTERCTVLRIRSGSRLAGPFNYAKALLDLQPKWRMSKNDDDVKSAIPLIVVESEYEQTDDSINDTNDHTYASTNNEHDDEYRIDATRTALPPSLLLLERVDNLLLSSSSRKTKRTLQQKFDSLLQKADASHADDLKACESILFAEASSSTITTTAMHTPPPPLSSSDHTAADDDVMQSPVPHLYEWIYADCDHRGDYGRRQQRDNSSSNEEQCYKPRESYPIAIRTSNKDEPILTPLEVQTIRSAGLSFWNAQRTDQEVTDDDDDNQTSSSSKSRFTYQRKGNYEAHLTDLIANVDPSIKDIINNALRDKIYPIVRDAFYPTVTTCKRDPDDDTYNDLMENEEKEVVHFCVYDSLLICYNSTEVTTMHPPPIPNSSSGGVVIGAGQPLHRDKALVSVNIMMNSNNEFQGGGTFFENQLRSSSSIVDKDMGIHGDNKEATTIDEDSATDDNDITPIKYASNYYGALKPLGVGHGIAHRSDERHAGAATVEGVRFVLVFFLSGTTTTTTNDSGGGIGTTTAPRRERASRLKTIVQNVDVDDNDDGNGRGLILCRILHHRLAIKCVPTDGEAWHYLGVALKDLSLLDDSMEPPPSRQRSRMNQCSPPLLMELSVSCLRHSRQLLPCDGRLCNNLGLALERLRQFYTNDDERTTKNKEKDGRLHDGIVDTYRQSLTLHMLSERAGCDVGQDIESTCLNYGLYHANRDEFEDAVTILQQRFDEEEQDNNESSGDVISLLRRRIRYDGHNLLRFCERRLGTTTL